MNEIQEKELDVLKEVVKVIEKHGLRYFAIGGTCLGAVRHNGFIPWDDDVDIAMPREDYELFRNELYKELPAKYKKLDYDNSEYWQGLFVKIHDSETTLIEKDVVHTPDRYTGAFVDIMPIDGLPEKNPEKVVGKSNRLIYLNAISKKMPDNYLESHNVIKYAGRKTITFVCGCHYFSKKWEKMLEKYSFDQSSKTYFSWRSEKHSLKAGYKVVFPHQYFTDTQVLSFEDMSIRVPVKYEEYLTDDFGDYMQLPPPEKRNSGHEIFICDMETPCEHYAQLKREGKL